MMVVAVNILQIAYMARFAAATFALSEDDVWGLDCLPGYMLGRDAHQRRQGHAQPEVSLQVFTQLSPGKVADKY